MSCSVQEITLSDVVHAFFECAQQKPDQPAIVHNGHSLSYARLERLVRATALRLGPDPGVVGVLTARSAGSVVGLLGVLAANGIYCPIDPTFPIARRQALVSASGCRVVISAKPGLTPPTGVSLMDIADDAAPAGQEQFAVSAPEDPAYILFTSGSTGEPKPVVTPRGAIAAAVGALRELFGLTPSDRVLQFASLNWDTCFEEILPTLTSGGTLVFNDEAYSGSFHRLLRMIAAERITVLDLPTAFWHELVLHLTEDQATIPSCVRVVIIGGEAASSARLADWRARDTDRIRLINTYGCTETTLVTHAVDIHGPYAPDTGAWWGETGKVPMGRPLPHVIEHISHTGELLISGPSLALGYRGMPGPTAERFVVRYDGDRARRYFRTGDRVSRSTNGMLVHEGRLDHEIKVRGIRVDPGEVEAKIAEHPRVAAVAVVGVTVVNHTTMVAYVVPRSQAHAATLSNDIFAYLRNRVPNYLVPSRITVVPDLLYTASGKVDRIASRERHHPTITSRRVSGER